MRSQLDGLRYLDVHQHWLVTCWHGTPVVIFDDERAVLTALWEARLLGWFQRRPLLIRLDAHHDQWPLEPAAEQAWLTAIQRGSRREIAMSVEFDIGCDDADWVRAAAVAQLTGDVVTFYLTEKPDPAPLPGVSSVLLGRISAELDQAGGRLAAGSDLVIPGWDARTARFGGDFDYVLSIDLDAFSTTSGSPWPAAELAAELTAGRPSGGARVCDVLSALAERAALVTIAREPAYCGGDLAAAGILRALDDGVFGGALTAG